MREHDEDTPALPGERRTHPEPPLPCRERALPCLRLNPLTGRAEPGHFTAHPADVMGPACVEPRE